VLSLLLPGVEDCLNVGPHGNLRALSGIEGILSPSSPGCHCAGEKAKGLPIVSGPVIVIVIFWCLSCGCR